MRKPILPAAGIALALLTCTGVNAQPGQFAGDPNAGTDVVVKDVIHPLDPQAVTQNVDPDTLVDGLSTACVVAGATTDTSWWRLFDLDSDHGLIGDFGVESVDWATESVVGPQDLTINVYCLEESLPFLIAFLDWKGWAEFPLWDERLTFHNTEVHGSCTTEDEDMAVELRSEDCNQTGACLQLFIGMNDLGQTAPTYISAPDCGVIDPADLSTAGFPGHLVMVVNGHDAGHHDDGCHDDGGDNDVPATTGVGAVLLLLILLGSGAYFLRGRANRGMCIPRRGAP